MLVREPILKDGDTVFDSIASNDLCTLNGMCDDVIANRYDSCLDDAKDNVYERSVRQKSVQGLKYYKY